MGKAQREKGKRGERMLAKELRELTGNSEIKRGVQYHGGPDSPDVMGLDGVHIECKFVEKLNVREALKQSEDDAGEGEVPVVIHKTSRQPWIVTMNLSDFVDMYMKSNR